MRRFAFATILMTLLCGCGPQAVTPEEDRTQIITLPDGTHIRVEIMIKQDDVLRGMMYRDSLAADRGMLFIHKTQGLYPYWMYKVKMPLDILWLDFNRRVLLIVPNAPPCGGNPRECIHYGSDIQSQLGLMLPAGTAAKHGLKVGDTIQF